MAIKQTSGFEDDPRTPHCVHPEHQPPSLLYIPPGKIYRHVCPACGYTVRLRGSSVTMAATQQTGGTDGK